ncbi:MAG: RNA-directed DNA polymerase [Bacteroidales bacterium]|jgi:hypothetical protein|nr:RNA-directed DNA polymerase [Bacteroidales bacterium]
MRLKYKKERVVLSDVLPFEIPIIFSNRYFYRFLVSYGIEIKNNKLLWNNDKRGLTTKKKETLLHIIKLLFGCKPNENPQNNSFDLNKNRRRIPFVYKITHKEKEFRELAVVHPKNQIDIVEFYEKYKELILYYSGISRFSLRRPFEIAKYVFFNDKLHKQKTGLKDDSIEVNFNEYEHLKTFFVYKKYTNIFRFYEDYRYQRAEKKYDKLIRFDISKCFDSIYTHSLSWALLNKEMVKDNIPLSKNTFSGKFDEFMQNINYGETNGILIGPEFSRIFAELILQQVDKTVENKLLGQEPKIRYRVDYECYRYVDDYFLFYNDDNIKDEILKLFKLELREFKMWISESKTKLYNKPIITELSMAKLKIVDLLDENIKFKIEEAEKEDEEIEESKEEDNPVEKIEDKFIIYMNPNKLSAKFKTILKETNVEYKDILNYTLSIISRKIKTIFKKFDLKYKQYVELEKDGQFDAKESRKKYNLEKRLTTFVINLLDFIFFLYTVYPKVNSTIKLTVILTSIINYYKGNYKFEKVKIERFQNINRDLILKKIQDEIRLILGKNKFVEHIQVETLYLLIILKELGSEYQLPEIALYDYFNCREDEKTGDFIFRNELNCFSIIVLLYYISDDIHYQGIKNVLLSYIISKIEKTEESKRRRKTELTIMLFDLLSCPYITNEYKKKLLSLYGISEDIIQSDILDFQKAQKYWFTKWDKINLEKELNAKICQEVYS